MYPADLGFTMPPEWIRHERTFMEWPLVEAIWPGPFDEILDAYSRIVEKISEFEPVTVIARPDVADSARAYCGAFADILPLAHDDSWMRDNGPTFVTGRNNEIAGIVWMFNAWGGKYPCENDNMVASGLLGQLGIRSFSAPIVMEGGSIHVDGEGTLLTTEECLLNKNRNPDLCREDIERFLSRYLNIEKVIWLKKGLDGDDTDGHIDNVACFAKPGVVLLQTSSNPANKNYDRSLENLEILRNATDARGRKLEVIQIEQPDAEYFEDTYLTLSYINFYFVNGGIILPAFGGRHASTDKNAESILKKTFPDRRIATVNSLPLVRGGGNVHCLTQQMPSVPGKISR